MRPAFAPFGFSIRNATSARGLALQCWWRVGRQVALVAVLVMGVATDVAATPLEDCANASPTTEGIAICLDDLFDDAELELINQTKRVRAGIQAMKGASTRSKASHEFERQHKNFLAARRAECGHLSDRPTTGVGDNQVRDCFIRMTHERLGVLEQVVGKAPQRRSTGNPREPVATASDAVYNVAWRLVKMIRDGKEIPLPAQYNATLRLGSDGAVTGKGAVNAFSGEFRLRTAGKIEWTQHGFLTERTAGPPELASLDELYIDALERVSSAALAPAGLILRSEDEAVTLTFAR
ncbi:MAG: META domain-containing protein [Betaproteobacteria bacterium]